MTDCQQELPRFQLKFRKTEQFKPLKFDYLLRII